MARLPTTETRPSRGPWLASRLCCPDGSSLTTASSEPLNPSPPLRDSRRGLLHPRKIGLRWESRGSPIDSAGLGSRAASHTPVPRRVRMTVASSSVLAFTSELQVRRSHWSFPGCRVHSEFTSQSCYGPRAGLPSFRGRFHSSLRQPSSPWISVKYDYVGKQSIPTTGLSPASPSALWAAEPDLTPRSPLRFPANVTTSWVLRSQRPCRRPALLILAWTADLPATKGRLD